MNSIGSTTPPDQLSQVETPITIQIVIPTFNRSNLLKRAIGSVINQTYPHWQLLVVDNASSDNTREIVSEAMREDARIHYYCHGHNVGMLANWEFAISKVDTDYFSLLCDDDFLLPVFFDSAMREVKRHPELGLCFGVTRVIDDDGNQLSLAPNEMTNGYYKAGEGAAAMMTLQHPATPAVLFCTARLRAVGGFDRNSIYVADLDMMLRVAFKYPIQFFEEQAACYVVHANNSFKDISGWHPGLLNLIRNLKELDNIDSACLDNVFNSFCKHAVLPQIRQFLRKPFSAFNPKAISSAVHCLVEMRLLSKGAASLYSFLIRRIAYQLGHSWRVFNSIVNQRGLARAVKDGGAYFFRRFTSSFLRDDVSRIKEFVGNHPDASTRLPTGLDRVRIIACWVILSALSASFALGWFFYRYVLTGSYKMVYKFSKPFSKFF